jgi:putative endonuclease
MMQTGTMIRAENWPVPVARRRAPAKRRAAEVMGRGAEDLVAQQLEVQGFAILARRLRTGAGEIDLVVADAERLVFIEVKARGCLADAAYSVSARQQARLLEAASVALATHEDWARDEIRFDVALVAGGAVEILPDAIRFSCRVRSLVPAQLATVHVPVFRGGNRRDRIFHWESGRSRRPARSRRAACPGPDGF